MVMYTRSEKCLNNCIHAVTITTHCWCMRLIAQSENTTMLSIKFYVSLLLQSMINFARVILDVLVIAKSFPRFS